MNGVIDTHFVQDNGGTRDHRVQDVKKKTQFKVEQNRGCEVHCTKLGIFEMHDRGLYCISFRISVFINSLQSLLNVAAGVKNFKANEP